MNIIFYAYYLADKDIPKVDADWAPLKIKQWIKGEPIRGRFTIPLQDGGQRTFHEGERAAFMDGMWRSLAHKLEAVIDTPHAIIPIPGREVIRGHHGSYRTLDYANAIASHAPGLLAACDVLRWKEVREPQRGTSGWRSPMPRYDNLDLIWRPDIPCIIFDDICTSGSSIAAAQWKLEDAGAQVVLSTAVLRPTHERFERMSGWFDEQCPAFSRPLI